MNKLLFIILCIIVLAVSFMGCLYLLSPQTFSILIEAATTRLTAFINIWNSLPETVRWLIPMGVSAAFTMFFAWTKTRAVQQGQQIQEQASQTITQLQGQAKDEIAQKDATIQNLQTQIETLKTPDNTALLEAQGLVTKLQGEVNSYKTQIEALNHAIAELKMKTVTIPK